MSDRPIFYKIKLKDEYTKHLALQLFERFVLHKTRSVTMEIFISIQWLLTIQYKRWKTIQYKIYRAMSALPEKQYYTILEIKNNTRDKIH